MISVCVALVDVDVNAAAKSAGLDGVVTFSLGGEGVGVATFAVLELDAVFAVAVDCAVGEVMRGGTNEMFSFFVAGGWLFGGEVLAGPEEEEEEEEEGGGVVLVVFLVGAALRFRAFFVVGKTSPT